MSLQYSKPKPAKLNKMYIIHSAFNIKYNIVKEEYKEFNYRCFSDNDCVNVYCLNIIYI